MYRMMMTLYHDFTDIVIKFMLSYDKTKRTRQKIDK